jgi:hypothetical protein
MTAGAASSACTTQTEEGSVSTEQQGLEKVALHDSQRSFIRLHNAARKRQTC